MTRAANSIASSSTESTSIPTPLLDAAFARLEALKQQQADSSKPADPSTDSKSASPGVTVRPTSAVASGKSGRADARGAGGKASPPPTTIAGDTPVPSATTSTSAPTQPDRSVALATKPNQSTGRSSEPESPRGSAPAPPSAPKESPQKNPSSETADSKPDVPPLPPSSPDVKSQPGMDDPESAEISSDPAATMSHLGTAEEERPLAITELRLCRSVHGFGSFEEADATALTVGQRLILYWELAGLRYEKQDNVFHSTISSRIEMRVAGFASTVWEHDLGTAEDTCRHPRRDYYANCEFSLPERLSPGPYSVRLIQTDKRSQQTTSADIPITIVR
jgi:hypothetical protein